MNTPALVLVSCVCLASCMDTHVVPTSEGKDISAVKGFEDCKSWIGYVEGRSVVIVRCPNATTSTSHRAGKVTVTAITVEGKK